MGMAQSYDQPSHCVAQGEMEMAEEHLGSPSGFASVDAEIVEPTRGKVASSHSSPVESKGTGQFLGESSRHREGVSGQVSGHGRGCSVRWGQRRSVNYSVRRANGRLWNR